MVRYSGPQRPGPVAPDGHGSTHPPDPSSEPAMVVILGPGHECPATDCIALALHAYPHAVVFRWETPARLIRDPVLEFRQGSAARFIAHWIVRLFAVSIGFGATRAIAIAAAYRTDAQDVLARLEASGARIVGRPPTLH